MSCRTPPGPFLRNVGGGPGAGPADAEESEALCSTNRRHRRTNFRFNRKQLLTLASMLLVDCGAFASISIMAPFFPQQVGLSSHFHHFALIRKKLKTQL